MGLRTKLLGKMGFRKPHPLIDIPNKCFHPMVAQQRLLEGIEAPIIIDIGAHEGQTALSYREYFPDGTIYSFEPHPDVFAKMTERVRGDANIHPVQMAASNVNGHTSLHTTDFSPANSLLPLHEKISHWAPPALTSNAQTIDIETVRLDTFCQQKGLNRVHCLKSDAQGYDLAVLQGAEGILSEVSLVIVEANVMPHYEGQGSMAEIMAFMERHHFRLFDLFCGGHNLAGQLMWCDLLFVGPSLEERCHTAFK